MKIYCDFKPLLIVKQLLFCVLGHVLGPTDHGELCNY